MRRTIDAAGRIVIPLELRRAAGIEPGVVLDLRLENGAVVIEPAATTVRIERRRRFAVANPVPVIPPLTNDIVQETRDQLARERGKIPGRKRR